MWWESWPIPQSLLPLCYLKSGQVSKLRTGISLFLLKSHTGLVGTRQIQYADLLLPLKIVWRRFGINWSSLHSADWNFLFFLRLFTRSHLNAVSKLCLCVSFHFQIWNIDRTSFFFYLPRLMPFGQRRFICLQQRQLQNQSYTAQNDLWSNLTLRDIVPIFYVTIAIVYNAAICNLIAN